MITSGRGIELVLTFALVVSTSYGCGRVSLGSTTSAGGDASVDAAGTASNGGTSGSATSGVAGSSHDAGATGGSSTATTGNDAGVVGAGGDAAQPPYCGISADVGQVDCGDVNRDWVIDNRDALLLAQYAEGMAVTVWLGACDVNCDGQITIADAHMIDEYVVGLISDFPCAGIQR